MDACECVNVEHVSGVRLHVRRGMHRHVIAFAVSVADLETLASYANVVSTVEALLAADGCDIQVMGRIVSAALALDDAFLGHMAERERLGLSDSDALHRPPAAAWELASGRHIMHVAGSTMSGFGSNKEVGCECCVVLLPLGVVVRPSGCCWSRGAYVLVRFVCMERSSVAPLCTGPQRVAMLNTAGISSRHRHAAV